MIDDDKLYRQFSVNLCILFAFLIFAFSSYVSAQPQDINWVVGPKVIDLDDNIAQFALGENYLYANAADTKKIMESIGNPPSSYEVGFVTPKDQDAGWYIVFEYIKSGYIKDDEKDSIDSDAILKSIRAGTEEANKIRRKKGHDQLNIVGWYEKPHYDVYTNNLVWTILGESSGNQVVNYNVRLLGRYGYMSVVLVTSPETLDAEKSNIGNIIASFSYKEGKKYAEYVQGDKISKYGLTALIAGGAGAAAVKFGLFKVLAKAWKLVVVGIIAFFGAIWRIITAIFGRSERKIDNL